MLELVIFLIFFPTKVLSLIFLVLRWRSTEDINLQDEICSCVCSLNNSYDLKSQTLVTILTFPSIFTRVGNTDTSDPSNDP